VKRRAGFALALLVAAGTFATAPTGGQEPERRRGFSIKITSPQNLEIVLGKSKIAATVKADRQEDVERVEFLVGDKVIFVDREAPYETFYDFGEKARSWVVKAVAYHREGLKVGDAIVTRRVEIGYVEEVNRVLLWATVLDKEGHMVFDLAKDDFRIVENGKPQKILEFGREERPITLAILLDTSGSMREGMKEVHEAAKAFVETLGPDDQALLITFDDKVLLVQEQTSDKAKLKEAIESTEALEGTALNDALHAAYRKLRGIRGRKAIILLSDGEDTTSQFSQQRVLEEVRGSSVLLYAVGIGSADKKLLRELSEVTGGRAYFADKASELAGVYQQIALELRGQFFLAYETSNQAWDGRWVEVRVETTKPDLKVRSRSGFPAVRGINEDALPPAPHNDGGGGGGGMASSGGMRSSGAGVYPRGCGTSVAPSLTLWPRWSCSRSGR
jgi:Ca-activated chloride channel homolog